MKEEMIEIIKQAQKGNEEAFNQLFQCYYGKAYGIAWQITKNDADAKDVIQEAFLSIHASLKDLREPENFSAWMRMIIISKCNKLFRKKHDFPIDPNNFNVSSKSEYRTYMSPHEQSSYINEQEVLRKLISNLKPKYQIILEYVYLKQFKIDEVATLLNISSGTVKTRLHRARKDLLIEVRKFEKENKRTLDFHSDIILPGIILSVLYKVRRRISECFKIITTNTATLASCSALGIVLISGGVMVKLDTNLNNTVSLPVSTNLQNNDEYTNTSIIANDFPATKYFDRIIYSNKDAYFICMNFAMNEDEMKKKTKDELQKIEPIYEALKKEDSEYYHRLLKNKWASYYEQAISKM